MENKDTSKPFNPSQLTEKIVTHFSLNPVNSDIGNDDDNPMSENMLREVMALQEEIANVFIAHKTDMATSYMVLAAMADSVYAYLLLGNLTEQ